MGMEILDLEQGSDKWLEYRLDYPCASEASAMMNESKFMSRNQLLALKKGWQSNPVDSFKQKLFDKGHEHEARARYLVEMEICDTLNPVVGMRVIDGLKLLSSFDGYIENGSSTWIWEHKSWNLILSENVRNAILEPTHYWQLEHQALTADTDQVNFMVSDGTLRNRVSMVYQSVPERRARLIEGWKQFLTDLESYEIEAKQEVVVAAELEEFPLLEYEVNGSLVVSNINDCLKTIKDRSALEMQKTLETDQDFADKETLNKAVKNYRETIKSIVYDMQNRFLSQAVLMDSAAELDSVLRKMQSHGERQVKQEKEKKKADIKLCAIGNISDHIRKCDKIISPMSTLSIIGDINPNFDLAMKSKRTIVSLKNAVDDLVSKAKIEINNAMERIEPNLAYLRENAEDYKFLFSDAQQIINQDCMGFIAIVKMRIADHKEAEEKRLKEERRVIREEEEAKAAKNLEDDREEMRKEELKKIEDDKKSNEIPVPVDAIDDKILPVNQEIQTSSKAIYIIENPVFSSVIFVSKDYSFHSTDLSILTKALGEKRSKEIVDSLMFDENANEYRIQIDITAKRI